MNPSLALLPWECCGYGRANLHCRATSLVTSCSTAVLSPRSLQKAALQAYVNNRDPESVYRAYRWYQTYYLLTDKLRFKTMQFFLYLVQSVGQFDNFILWVGQIVYCSRLSKHVVIFYRTNNIFKVKLRFNVTQNFIFCLISQTIGPIYPIREGSQN